MSDYGLLDAYSHIDIHVSEPEKVKACKCGNDASYYFEIPNHDPIYVCGRCNHETRCMVLED